MTRLYARGGDHAGGQRVSITGVLDILDAAMAKKSRTKLVRLF